MTAVSPDLPTPRIALFDLDGTLTWHDTLFAFLVGYALRRPAKWPRLWQLLPAAMRYVMGKRDRGLLKSRVIRIIMGGDPRRSIEEWADLYVAALQSRGTFRPAALAVLEQHRAAGDYLVLLSASPDLYVPRIGLLLGFGRTLCTEVKWSGSPPDERLDGALLTPNRRGGEKTRCLERLRAQYPGLPVVAYGNSASDLPHLREADQALLVNGNASARRAAAELHIAVADWT
jgi:phosphatidylglycerophosphatase C